MVKYCSSVIPSFSILHAEKQKAGGPGTMLLTLYYIVSSKHIFIGERKRCILAHSIVPEVLEHKVVWLNVSMYDATLVQGGHN